MTSSSRTSPMALGFDLNYHALSVRWVTSRLLSPLEYLHVSSYILTPSPRHSVFPTCDASQISLFQTQWSPAFILPLDS